jgi:hypothetical protein
VTWGNAAVEARSEALRVLHITSNFTPCQETWAYRIPDTRIFIREWPPENVSQDGRLDAAPPRPVLFLEVPPGITVGEKRAMGKRISAAVTAAYHLADVLIFLREYPLDMVIQDGGLQSENPVILQAMEQAAASHGTDATTGHTT